MDGLPIPRPLDAAGWQLVGVVVNHMIVLMGLAVNAALSMLLSHAIIPSLVMTHDAPNDIQVFRRVLYPIAAVSAILAIYSFTRAIAALIGVVNLMYPSFAI